MNGRRATLVLTLIALASAGCQEDLDPRYGEAVGVGSHAVNGLGVFAEMLASADHQVHVTPHLSPRWQMETDVIVWAPDDMQLPSDEARAWFEEWFATGYGRVLVYIGRDYDAAETYWNAVAQDPQVDAARSAEYRRRANLARTQLAQARNMALAAGSQTTDLDWFERLPLDAAPASASLDGRNDWLSGVDPQRVKLVRGSRLVPIPEAETLLGSADAPWVSTWSLGQGQLILVENGSFLFNGPLVEHEHRKLAGKLIAELGAAQRVVVLESGPDGPSIFDEDQSAERSGLEIFYVAPFDAIFLHLAIAGVIFACGRWPIFGLPRSLTTEHASDFGQHIAATGRLLSATRQRAFAEARSTAYPPAAPERGSSQK